MKCVLTLEADGMINDVDVRAATRIDPLMLDETIQECPANLAFYGSVCARIRCDMDRQEWVLKKTKAVAAMKIRNNPDNKKITQSCIEDMVELDDTVQAEYEKLFELRENYESVHSFVSALYAQRELLVTLCANQRAEMKMAETT